MQKLIKRYFSEYFKESPDSIKRISGETREDSNGGSFLIKFQDKKVKCLIFRDKEELSSFLKYVPRIKRVPKIIFVKEHYVFVEWLDGEVLKKEDLKENDLLSLAKLQSEFHKIKINENSDFIINLVKKKIESNVKYLENEKLFIQDDLNKIKNILINKFPKNPKIGLIHADFNLDNLLKTKKGIHSIDNETIHVSFIGFDFGKPLNNICKNDFEIKNYLDFYNRFSDIHFYLKDRQFYDLFYLLKQFISRNKNNLPNDKNLIKIHQIIS